MATWAELDKNNIVIRVTVGNNEELDEGYQWLLNNLGGTWVKTSYNTFGGIHTLGGIPFRKNFGRVGYSWDEGRDAFYAPKPFASWTLDEETCQWNSPVEYPNDEKVYLWDEESLSWVEAIS